ncbi:hypothetical protein PHYPSEUDO_013323 [Phytophthora pseudosyringae]|uniref:GAF domain-containing protein n=1 Tax=Phytophthora pseudosyringae TaxID=221518 RepID=A0A8T1W3F3_9STRA|nr:hypothetical protein PHYPSEUDO_013323 [Phytophthora pseudosyringae]
MSFNKMRGILDVRRQRGWSGSQHSESSRNTFDPAPSFSTEHSDTLEHEPDLARLYKLPSEAEMLHRAREAHAHVDFGALSAGSEHGGPWQRVEGANRFDVFKRPVSTDTKANRLPGLEVLCAGQLEASLEEVASVFRSNSEMDHLNTMEGLYKKSFIFGSLDRELSCSGALLEEPQSQDDDSSENTRSEQLNVKTSSFLRSTLFGRNEQWCYSDFFHRKVERDGFRISQRALPPFEPTPGRVVGENARVDQLHGLNASYVVDQLPNRKGLRVVYNAWFEDPMKDLEASTTSSDSWRQSSGLSVTSSVSSRSIESFASGSDKSFPSRSDSDRRRSSELSIASNSSFVGLNEAADGKTQLRRLLMLAHGVTKLPNLIQRRRFGIQVPADLKAVQVANTRCPCCTHSLAAVKMSLSKAASALASRNFRSLRSDTRRCYLCGYLVCIDCWSAECMESTAGRVAAIVVCTRCHASVKACDYSEVYAPGQEDCRGPVKVVDDQDNGSLAPLLTDFLSASLMNASASGEDRSAVLSVIQSLLRQSACSHDESDESSYDDSDYDEGFGELHNVNVSVVELGKYLRDEDQLLELEACVFANAERRAYPIEQPDDPVTMVPPTIVPPHEQVRLQLVNDKGLMLLAKQLAPVDPAPDAFENVSDVRDLDILCQLAVRASGCANTFVSIMGTEHLHILSSSNPAFLHATMPREHTVCQHTILTPNPFIISHPEADVRFHELGAIKALATRCYMGFPLTVPMIDTDSATETEMPVGTLCCVTPQARSELTRSQYVTLKRIAHTASRLIQLKSRQLQQQQQSAATSLAV